MTAIFLLIDQLASGIYIILGAGTLWYLRKWFVEKSEYKATYFELERDLTHSRQIMAITTVVLLIQVGLIVLGVQRVVVPVLLSEQELSSILVERQAEADGTFVTPTPPPVVAGLDIAPVEDLGSENEFQQIIQTPTPTFTPVGTIVANPPDDFGCDTDEARLTVPANGMRVFEPIIVRGTAFTENFSSAKIEISGPTTLNQYQVLEDLRQPVFEDGVLSQFVPAPFEAGLYQYRLMIFDIDNVLRASCMVNIFISERPATPTPRPQ